MNYNSIPKIYKLSLKSSRRGTTYAPLLRSSPIQHHSWFLGYVRVSSRILVSRCRAEPPPITRDEFCYPTSGAKKKRHTHVHTGLLKIYFCLWLPIDDDDDDDDDNDNDNDNDNNDNDQ
ncbi:hypothetical protein HZH68_006757 [Vespula germanica]|uniref:Uncharacterized protein n=1 Tax=Vespula germanica TaxID=30212 RepID=A0A834KC26_VESGE|nr:hypothetical protein HZH68_006757 [Vespula germanica]